MHFWKTVTDDPHFCQLVALSLILLANFWPFSPLEHLFQFSETNQAPSSDPAPSPDRGNTLSRGNKHWGFLSGTPVTSSSWSEVKRLLLSHVYNARVDSTGGVDMLLPIQPNLKREWMSQDASEVRHGPLGHTNLSMSKNCRSHSRRMKKHLLCQWFQSMW